MSTSKQLMQQEGGAVVVGSLLAGEGGSSTAITGPARPAAAAASAAAAAHTPGGSSAVQSELARLRFQVDHLREENALQAAELAAAQGVLGAELESASASAHPTTSMPLQLRVQAQKAELHDAKLRAQQATGVAAARQRELESLHSQLASLQMQLRASQMELTTARAAADEAAAGASEAHRMHGVTREEKAAAVRLSST